MLLGTKHHSALARFSFGIKQVASDRQCVFDNDKAERKAVPLKIGKNSAFLRAKFGF